MRKLGCSIIGIFAFVVISLLAGDYAWAYKSAGCGIGAEVFKDSDDDASQIFASSTNFTLFNQMFAITSGTSGCREKKVLIRQKEEKKDDKKKEEKKQSMLDQQMFISANFDDLSQEMARGDGEYLNAFSKLLGCPAPAFKDWAKKNYKDIDHTNPDKMLESIWNKVSTDPGMSQSCEFVG